jgi:hypothetical protein
MEWPRNPARLSPAGESGYGVKMSYVGRVYRGVNSHRFRKQLSAAADRAARTNTAVATYLGLHPLSVSLTTVRYGSQRRFVNLLLPSIKPKSIFAGVRTAVEVAVDVAERYGADLRVVTFNSVNTRSENEEIRSIVKADFGGAVIREIRSVLDVQALEIGAEDLWIPTHWTTAHAVDVACRIGSIDPSRVLYLIQDYEVGFLPMGTNASLAAATYQAGFQALVNSEPLRQYLETAESVPTSPLRTFAPRLDLDRLRSLPVDGSAPSSGRRVLFYGRPSKPRNMFNLGVAALRRVSSSLDDPTLTPEFASIGEDHPDIPLGGGVQLRSIGRVGWNDYFRHLAQADVVLSLQATPHPSHPPLDAVVSGGRAVTNELGGTRDALHPRLVAVQADPDSLARALAQLLVSPDLARDEYDDAFVKRLGLPLSEALDNVVFPS